MDKHVELVVAFFTADRHAADLLARFRLGRLAACGLALAGALALLGLALRWPWLGYLGSYLAIGAVVVLLLGWLRLMRAVHDTYDRWFDREYARNVDALHAREAASAASPPAGEPPGPSANRLTER